MKEQWRDDLQRVLRMHDECPPGKCIEMCEALEDLFDKVLASQRETLAVELLGKIRPPLSPNDGNGMADHYIDEGFNEGLTDAAAHIRKQL